MELNNLRGNIIYNFDDNKTESFESDGKINYLNYLF